MKDIFIYIKSGGSFLELNDAVKNNTDRLEKHGYNIKVLSPDLLPPKDSKVLIMGDWKSLDNVEDKLVNLDCSIALYLLEPLPGLTYDGTYYPGDPSWVSTTLHEFEAIKSRYDYLVFYEGSMENFVLDSYPEFKDRTCTHFMGVDESYVFRDPNAQPQHDFTHFGWCPFGNRRNIRLERLSRKFNIYPTWSSFKDDRTKALNSSKYLLYLNFFYQPYFTWIRFIFSVCNKMPLFSEKSFCEPVYTRERNISHIRPNIDFVEFPYMEGQGSYKEHFDVIKSWLERPDDLTKMADDNYKYFFENYRLSDCLKNLLEKIFI